MPEKRFICLVLFLDAVGVGLILPVMPDLILELDADGSVEHAAAIGGWLLFAYAGMQFLLAPTLGGLSDRYGRRPVLLFALAGFSLSYLLMAAAPSLAFLFLARLVSGAFGATYPAAMAAMADLSSKETRAANFGLVGASLGAGFVLGPAIGGVIGEYGARLPFIAAGALCAAALLYGLLAFPETLPQASRRAFNPARANPLGALLGLRTHPVILPAFAALFCVQLAGQSYTSIWAFFAIEVVDWTPFAIGLSAAAYGVMMAGVQGGLTGRAVKAFGEPSVIFICLLLGILSYAVAGQARSGAEIYLAVVLGGLAGMAYPALQAVISQQTPDDAQGELQGAIASAYGLSAIIGPLLMTQLFRHYADDAGPYAPGAPFYAAAGLIVLAMIVYTLFALRQAYLVGGVSKS